MNKIKAIKYKIKPNKTQEVLLNKTFGCVRKVWNTYVAVFNSYDRNNNPKPVYKTIKELKVDFPYLEEVPYNALEQKVCDFNEFKKQHFNKNRKKQVGRPNFKSKGHKESFRLSPNGFRIKDDGLYLAKLGKVMIYGDRDITSIPNIKNVTVSKNPDGNMYVSVQYEEDVVHLPKTGDQIGIDLGLIDLIADSQGNKVANPKYLEKKLDKIKKLQAVLSRKKKGSNRRNKARKKLARQYQKVKNQRNWLAHQISIDLVRKYDLICCEDLNIIGMAQNLRLARAINSAAWYSLITKIKYKCDWYGKDFVQIDRYFASSKICSNCGHKATSMNLDVREWTCTSCGTKHDRDINAAKNILAEGKRLTGL